MKVLEGKNMLITGAGGGIGKLMALKLAEEKANLILIDINGDALNDLAKVMASFPGRVATHTCDISDAVQVDTVAKAVKKEFGMVDVLINNAGIVSGKPFLDLTTEEMHRSFNVNFWGHLYFTRHFLPDMIKKGEGNIVNIASSAGMLGMANLSDYCASKFADVGFTETLRRELKRDGHKKIKITCVCPYIIDTGMFSGFKPLFLNPILKPEDVVKKVIRAIKKNKPYVIMPFFMVTLMLLLKVILPTGLFDWTLRVFGGSKAMDTFIGRK